jgi:hypothetical protein
MNNISYSIPWDKTVSVVTYTILIVFTVLSILLIYQLFKKPNYFIISALIMFIAIPLIAYIYAPREYVINKNGLTIKLGISSILIPKSEISSIYSIPTEKMNKTNKSFASGGLFGYYGKFENKTLGSFKMYTGRFDSLIMIVTNNGDKIIISPVNPKNFINKLNDITTEKEKM